MEGNTHVEAACPAVSRNGIGILHSLGWAGDGGGEEGVGVGLDAAPEEERKSKKEETLVMGSGWRMAGNRK